MTFAAFREPIRYHPRSMLKCVDRILLRVPNVTAASRFYTEAMGLRVDRQQPNAAALRFQEGDTELILHDDRQRPDVEIVFGVKDVRQMFDDRDRLGLTFLAPPAKVGNGYRATMRDPFGNVLVIVDRGDAVRGLSIESSEKLFDEAADEAPAVDREKLIEVYVSIARTADDLPYTPHFERLYSLYTRSLASDPKPSHNDVWRQLLTLRKSAKLPKLGPATSKPPKIEAEDKQRLKDILGPDIGRRDRLPYTERFDEIVRDFNKQFARAWSPHVVWRLVATLAK